MSFKIEVLFAGEWMELMGHGCDSFEEAQRYVETNGKTFRIVEV